MRTKLLIILSSFLMLFSSSLEDSDQYQHQVVVKGLSNPWGFTFLPDDSMLITEKRGELIHFKNGKKMMINRGVA